MSELIRGSLFWRLCAGFAAWLGRSFIGRFFAFLGTLWRDSGTYRLCSRLLLSPSLVERSGYRRLLDGLNDRLHGLRPLLQESFFLGLLRRLYAWLKKSYNLGKVFSRGITGVLLFVAAAYAPLDYLLRDVLQLAAIASVWDELLILFCFFWTLFRRADSEKKIASRGNATDLFLAFYLLAGVVLLICTVSNLGVNITGMRASMQYILLFFVIVRLIRDREDLMMMYKVMVLIAFAIALHGIWQFIIGVEIPSSWTDQAEQSVRTRVFSIFSNPNIMGGYMVMFAPMAIGMAYSAENLSEKLFYWFAGICMCLGCLFTMSRGSWMSLVVAAVLFALIIDRKLFAMLLVGGLAACMLPFVRSRIGYLFTDAFARSNATGGRAKRWAMAFTYLNQEDAWTFGLGFGIYGGAVAVQNPIRDYEYMYVDNYYVKTLAENGIVGLSCLLTSLSGLLYQGGRTIAKTAKTPYKPLCTGMLAGLVGILVQSLFESMWEEPYMMALFFIVAAMMICAGLLHREGQRKSL